MLVVAAGCGRIGFEPAVAADGSVSGSGLVGCSPAALLCDDFETGDLSKWSAPFVFAGASADVDRVRPHAGAFGLDATVPPSRSNGNAATACVSIQTISSGTLAVREWINAADVLTNFDSMLALSNIPSCIDPDPQQYAQVACDDTQTWDVTEAFGVNAIDHQASTACPAVGTWTCVEIDYVFGPPPRIQLFVNDAKVLDAAPNDPSPTFSAVLVGAPALDRGRNTRVRR